MELDLGKVGANSGRVFDGIVGGWFGLKEVEGICWEVRDVVAGVRFELAGVRETEGSSEGDLKNCVILGCFGESVDLLVGQMVASFLINCGEGE